MIDSRTTLTGLFGFPTKHSLSPLIHNYVFEKKKINCVYLCFEIKPKDLEKAVKALKVYNFIGVNVTIPFKQKIMRYLDRIDKKAQLIGAVNTIKNENGKLIGFNTDGSGFVKAIKKICKFNLKGKRVILLGCGGAGFSIGVSLCFEKIQSLELYDIQPQRVKKLASHLKKNFKDIQIQPVFKEKELMLKNADLLINATPCGMKDKKLPINIKGLNKNCLVYDLVYNPPQTPLLKECRKLGIRGFNGLSMLVFQATESENIWFKNIGDTSKYMFKILKDAGYTL